MILSIIKEDPRYERRVALTPPGVLAVSDLGLQVYVESGAGAGCHFDDEAYESVGAEVLYDRDELFHRSDVILKVSPPNESEAGLFQPSQVLLSFLHLAVAKTKVVDLLLDRGVTAIAYELIEDRRGNLPILQAMSEIAGEVSIEVAARYLGSEDGGRGIILGGIPGIPPANVVIIGAGTVGCAAARAALGVGAQVTLLDKDIDRLRSVEQQFRPRLTTALATPFNIRKAVQFADVLIGAVLIKGEKAPHLVTEDMVKRMKPGAVLIDVSIDQGGCIATSRPTTLAQPIFIQHGVLHYCVPNIPASVARSASSALTNSLLPYLVEILEKGPDRALKENPGLGRGVCTYMNICTNPAIGRLFSKEPTTLESVIPS